MAEKMKSKICELDELAEKAGGYVSNITSKDTHYDLHKLINYCKKKGIEPADLTLRELNNFIIS